MTPITCATVSACHVKLIAGKTNRARPTLTAHTCATAARFTSEAHVFRCDATAGRCKHEMLVKQIGRRHAAKISNDDRDLVWHEPTEGDATQYIDERGGAAREQEQSEALPLLSVHCTRSAISLPKRTLSEMP